ncbi:MAG TPA: hypothetical protein VGO07_05215 [Candidatus Saccharimonadales bacterium]|jgi:hypothetical protein|nr:hypothetical protein [Candidatus Saccharimonadales bacterium]
MCRLPEVDDAVLADMSGVLALNQDQLWQALGDAQTGQLPAWALSEASRMARDGVDARDAFIQGVGYAVAALTRQLIRDSDKSTIAEMFATRLQTTET